MDWLPVATFLLSTFMSIIGGMIVFIGHRVSRKLDALTVEMHDLSTKVAIIQAKETPPCKKHAAQIAAIQRDVLTLKLGRKTDMPDCKV